MLFSLIGVGSLIASGYFMSIKSQPIAFTFGIIAIALLGQGAFLFKQARNREFGKTFEKAMTPKAVSLLEKKGFMVDQNVIRRGVGDIDLIIRFVRNKPVPIEIKSFRKWNQFFFLKGDRERKALAQSAHQQRALRTHVSIIWLPQGKPTFLQAMFGTGSASVQVVFGNEHALVRAVEHIK